MSLPIFFTNGSALQNHLIALEEDTSRHIAQVLRMKAGEQLQLTDGSGNLLTTEIVHEHKKSTQVRVLFAEAFKPSAPQIAVAISLIKNTNRFEWFLEKATELGVDEIIPLICQRTEKQHYRTDRMKNILVSAMLQSRQVWLPRLHEPTGFQELAGQDHYPQKFIAHCLQNRKEALKDAFSQGQDTIILIGPEGDFTEEEIGLALQKQFVPVSLGSTRLRTETAGVAAAVILKAM